MADTSHEAGSARHVLQIAVAQAAGRQEDMVVYHFFHGGWLAQESAIEVGDQLDEFEVFYNMPLSFMVLMPRDVSPKNRGGGGGT